MADGKITIETVLDSSKFKKGLTNLSGLSKKGLGIATKAVGLTSAAIGVMGGAAIKAGADFKEGMSKVQAISGASSDEMVRLEEVAKKMGATTKFTAREAADGLSYMAMAGWKTEQMVSGLPGIMNLAAAAGADLATTSDIVTDALTAFKLEAKDAAHFADIMAAASSNANTNVEMLGESFKYAAPVAGALGYTAEDTSIALGIMANSGIKASQAGTSLRGALTRLAKPTKQVQAALDRYGISITDTHGKVKPLRTLMGELREKLGGLSKAEKAQAAAALFGQNALSGMLAIINSSDKDFDKLTNAIDNADGSAEKMAKTMQNNLKGQITILKSSLEGIGIEIYEGIDSPLTKTAKSAIKNVNAIHKAFKKGGAKKAAGTLGKALATGLAGAASQAPKIVKLSAKVIQGFAKGLYANRGQIVKATQSMIRALGEAIAAMLPQSVGNAMRNLANIFAMVLRPTLRLVGILLSLASAMSGLIVPVLGAVAAYKLYMAAQKTSIALDSLALVKKKAVAVVETFCAARKAALTATTTSLTASTAAQTVATTAYSVSAGIAAVATKAFSAALAFLGGPVGLLVVAFGALAGAALAFSSSSKSVQTEADRELARVKQLSKAVDDLSSSYKQNARARENRVADTLAEAQLAEDLTARIENLVGIENKSAAEKAKISRYVSQLNALYPELNLKYDEEKDKLNTSTKALWRRIRAIKAEAKAEAYRQVYTEAYKERIKAAAKDEELSKRLKSNKAKLVAAEKNYTKASMEGAQERAKALDELRKRQKSVDILEKAFKKNNATLKKSALELKSYDRQLDKLSKKKIKKQFIKPKTVKTKVKVNEKETAKALNAIEKLFAKLSGKAKKETKKTGRAVKDLPKAGQGVPARMSSVGRNIIAGLVQGIRSKGAEARSTMRGIVSDLVAIAKEVPDIHSPSRVFSWIGKMMIKGLTLGVRKEGRHTKRAVKWVIVDALNGAKRLRGNYESFGAAFAEKLGRALQGRNEHLKKKFEKSIAAALKNKKLDKKLKKLLSGKKGSHYIRKAGFIYNKAFNIAFNKLERAAKRRIKRLSRAFQKSYDKIIDNRKSMKEMLLGHGDLLLDLEEQNDKAADSLQKTADAVESASLSGVRALNTFDIKRTLNKNLKDIKLYGERLKALEGKVSKDILNDIIEMGVAEGSGYAKRLLKLDPDELSEYVANYKHQKEELLRLEKSYGKEKIEAEKEAVEKKTSPGKKFQLKNLGDDVKASKDFKKRINRLKKKKIPVSLMKEILGMDLETANAYMQELLRLSNADFKAYIIKWKEKQRLANEISKKFYEKDLNSLKKRYNKNLKREAKKIRKDMEDVGRLIVQSLTKTLNRDGDLIGRHLSRIVRKAVSEAKKELKVSANLMTKKSKTTNKQLNSKIPESTKRSIIKAKSNDGAKKRTTVIHTDVVVDGKVIAKATAKHTDAELGKRKKRKRRGI